MILSLLDGIFGAYAKLITKVAGFFGLREMKLICWWCWVSSFIALAPGNAHEWQFRVAVMVAFAVYATRCQKSCIQEQIKEAEARKKAGTAPKSLDPANRVERVMCIMGCFMMAAVCLVASPTLTELAWWWRWMALLKLLTPTFLWPYFIDNPYGGITARDLVNSTVSFLRKAFTLPVPEPVPQTGLAYAEPNT